MYMYGYKGLRSKIVGLNCCNSKQAHDRNIKTGFPPNSTGCFEAIEARRLYACLRELYYFGADFIGKC